MNGGYGCGTLVQIYGADSVGKDDLVYRGWAKNQEIWGPKSALCMVAIEMMMDKGQARNLGVQVSLSEPELRLIEESWGRPLTDKERSDLTTEIGTVCQLVGEDTESALQGALDAISSNAFQYVVVDSVGGMASKGSLEEEVVGGKESRASGRDVARLLTEFCAKVASLFNRGVLTVVVVLNQVREEQNFARPLRPGMPRPVRTAGGRALRHTKAVDIELSKFKWKLEDGESPFTSGQAAPNPSYVHWGTGVEWRLIKAKAGAHEGPRGRLIRYVRDHGAWRAWEINETLELRLRAAQVGLIEERARGHRLPPLLGMEKGVVCAKASDIAAYLERHREYRRALEELVIGEVLRSSGHIIARP